MQTDRQRVSRVLREIAQLLLLKGENRYRARAYDVAADRVLALEDLTERVWQGRLTEVPGIGEALSAVIAEVVTTGRSSLHQALVSEWGEGALRLLSIPQLTPRKLATLIQKYGVRDLDDLERAIHLGLIQDGERILQNLELVRRTERQVPFGKVLPLAESLLRELRLLPGIRRAEIGGALRRRCETVGEIQFVASVGEKPEPWVGRWGFDAQFKLALGKRQTWVELADGGLNVRLWVVPDRAFALALHAWSGSSAHRAQLERRAREQGMSLTAQRLLRESTGEEILIPNEAALYRALDMPFVPPELREGSLEWTRPIPDDLIRAEDLAGLVHCHSTYSDGRNTLGEMAEAAQALGLRYLTVTDHSEAASYAKGLNADRLRRQWDEIDALNSRLTTLRLFKGIEADILEDGSLDLGPGLLSKLDVVIGSIHQRHQMDEAQMTQRVLRALDSPTLHILGHPTGRLISRRPPYGLRMEEVLERAAARGVAMEVNGNPERQDLKADHVRMAVERGVKIVVSADAHSTKELSQLGFAVSTARRGWAKRGDVLNALPAEQFLQALHART